MFYFSLAGHAIAVEVNTSCVLQILASAFTFPSVGGELTFQNFQFDHGINAVLSRPRVIYFERGRLFPSKINLGNLLSTSNHQRWRPNLFSTAHARMELEGLSDDLTIISKRSGVASLEVDKGMLVEDF